MKGCGSKILYRSVIPGQTCNSGQKWYTVFNNHSEHNWTFEAMKHTMNTMWMKDEFLGIESLPLVSKVSGLLDQNRRLHSTVTFRINDSINSAINPDNVKVGINKKYQLKRIVFWSWELFSIDLCCGLWEWLSYCSFKSTCNKQFTLLD